MQEHYITIFQERLALLHGHIDTFVRHVKDRLISAQTPNITTIWTKIQQLRDKIMTVTPSPLMIPVPDITTEGLDRFADKHATHISEKRGHLRDNDSEAKRRLAKWM